MAVLFVARMGQAHVIRPAGGWLQPLPMNAFISFFPAENPPTAAGLSDPREVGQEFVKFRKISQL